MLTRIISSIVTIAFVLTQCGLGFAAPVYNQAKSQSDFAQSYEAHTSYKLAKGEVGKVGDRAENLRPENFDAPEDGVPAAGDARAAGLVEALKKVGSGRPAALAALTLVPAPALPAASQPAALKITTAQKMPLTFSSASKIKVQVIKFPQTGYDARTELSVKVTLPPSLQNPDYKRNAPILLAAVRGRDGAWYIQRQLGAMEIDALTKAKRLIWRYGHSINESGAYTFTPTNIDGVRTNDPKQPGFRKGHSALILVKNPDAVRGLIAAHPDLWFRNFTDLNVWTLGIYSIHSTGRVHLLEPKRVDARAAGAEGAAAAGAAEVLKAIKETIGPNHVIHEETLLEALGNLPLYRDEYSPLNLVRLRLVEKLPVEEIGIYIPFGRIRGAPPTARQRFITLMDFILRHITPYLSANGVDLLRQALLTPSATEVSRFKTVTEVEHILQEGGVGSLFTFAVEEKVRPSPFTGDRVTFPSKTGSFTARVKLFKRENDYGGKFDESLTILFVAPVTLNGEQLAGITVENYPNFGTFAVTSLTYTPALNPNEATAPFGAGQANSSGAAGDVKDALRFIAAEAGKAADPAATVHFDLAQYNPHSFKTIENLTDIPVSANMSADERNRIEVDLWNVSDLLTLTGKLEYFREGNTIVIRPSDPSFEVATGADGAAAAMGKGIGRVLVFDRAWSDAAITLLRSQRPNMRLDVAENADEFLAGLTQMPDAIVLGADLLSPALTRKLIERNLDPRIPIALIGDDAETIVRWVTEDAKFIRASSQSSAPLPRPDFWDNPYVPLSTRMAVRNLAQFAQSNRPVLGFSITRGLRLVEQLEAAIAPARATGSAAAANGSQFTVDSSQIKAGAAAAGVAYTAEEIAGFKNAIETNQDVGSLLGSIDAERVTLSLLNPNITGEVLGLLDIVRQKIAADSRYFAWPADVRQGAVSIFNTTRAESTLNSISLRENNTSGSIFVVNENDRTGLAVAITASRIENLPLVLLVEDENMRQRIIEAAVRIAPENIIAIAGRNIEEAVQEASTRLQAINPQINYVRCYSPSEQFSRLAAFGSVTVNFLPTPAVTLGSLRLLLEGMGINGGAFFLTDKEIDVYRKALALAICV